MTTAAPAAGPVAFIGLGNMGGPMARRLLGAGYPVRGFDLSPSSLATFVAAGGVPADSVSAAAANAAVVITMLPAGQHVRSVYFDGVLGHAPTGALLVDCSTIDVDSARAVANAAEMQGYAMLDAPVSGGVSGAEAGGLTFMVGGPPAAFARAGPLLAVMGKRILPVGAAGAGQAAKICNNLMLGIQMLSVCEGFALAERLGLDAQRLFDVASTASGQCWSLTTYCPEPGPVPASPANRDYQPGFSAAMMLKDLRLAMDAAAAHGLDLTAGATATTAYQHFAEQAGEGDRDFSGIIAMLKAAAEADAENNI